MADSLKFGEHVGKVTEALKECFEEPYVLGALVQGHQTLGGRSPIRVMWEDGEKGFEQVMHVTQTTIVRDAWSRGRNLMIHGWIYRLSDGKLNDLGVSVAGSSEVQSAYTKALAGLR